MQSNDKHGWTPRWKFAIGMLALWILLAPSIANAVSKTQIAVEFGWGGQIRPGTWTPIWVTLSDEQTRGVTLKLYSPHDPSAAMVVHQQMTIGPIPQTFALFVPLSMQLEQTEISIIDDQSGRLLTDPVTLVAQGSNYPGSFSGYVRTAHFIGVSGRAPFLTSSINGQSLTAGYVTPRRLPTVPIGFDALDLLVLNSIDFSKLLPEQQQAIVDWVNAGGSLLLWPAEGPIPTDPRSNPLLSLLPCRIGDSSVAELSLDQLVKAQIIRRGKTLRVRTLAPADDAIATSVLDLPDSMVRAHRGLGEVCVLSFDPTNLPFEFTGEANFWNPILAALNIERPVEDASQSGNYSNIYNPYTEDAARAAPRGQIMDLLGTVPGAGQVGFGFVAIGLGALMIIVGPVDWLVLRWLKRQPWTWVTTTGWIALVTLGSIYAGHVFKSGDLHFRSIRFVDQLEMHTLASHEMIGIYSPRTGDYSLQTSADAWWQPVNISGNYYGGSGTLAKLPFLQSPRMGESQATGNAPLAMPINIWNLRLLESARMNSGPPAIAAQIWLANGRPNAIITNHTDAPLTSIWLRRENALAEMKPSGGPTSPLPPGETGTFSGAFGDETWPEVNTDQTPQYPRGRYRRPAPQPSNANSPLGIIRNAASLSDLSESDVAKRLNPHIACLFGFSDAAVPETRIEADQAIQKHYLVIRALLPIGTAPAAQNP